MGIYSAYFKTFQFNFKNSISCLSPQRYITKNELFFTKNLKEVIPLKQVMTSNIERSRCRAIIYIANVYETARIKIHLQ